MYTQQSPCLRRSNIYDGELEYWIKVKERGTKTDVVTREQIERDQQEALPSLSESHTLRSACPPAVQKTSACVSVPI